MKSWKKARNQIGKNEKGITIVVLVITIIVLLILAGIAIRAIGDGGLTSQTKKAVSEYEEYKDEERNKVKQLIAETKEENQKTLRTQLVLIPSTKEWTNKNVVVTADAGHIEDGYSLYIKQGEDGEWQKGDQITVKADEYTGPTTITVGLVKDGEEINPTNQISIEISNIDIEKPTDEAPALSSTDNTVTARCRQEDTLSGIDTSKTKYAIREEGEEEWSEWQSNNQFTGLAQSTTYEVKVLVTDKAGNEQESQIASIETKKGEYPSNDAPTAVATTNKVIVTNNQKDDKNGIDDSKTMYAIRKEGEEEWSEWQLGNEFTNLDQNTAYEIKTQSTNGKDKTSESKITKVTTKTVPSGITLTPSTTEWTNEDVTVTATTEHTGYILQMSTDGTTWTETTEIAIGQNGTVYARLYDGNNYGEASTKQIDKIDKIAPTNTAPEVEATPYTITATFKQTDEGGSEIKTKKYRLTNQDGTSGEWVEDESDTHTFTNLETNTTYYIQTQATDNAGNITESEITSIRIYKISVYARLYDNNGDGQGDTLVISSIDNKEYKKGTLIKEYGEVPNMTSTSDNPWYEDREKIITTEIIDEIKPTSTAYWFCNCNNMKGIEKIENLNTSNVTTMNNLFNGCNSLESIDLSNFNTSNVTDMHNLFCDNWVLQSIDVSSFDTSKVEDMQGMFARCYELETIYASEEFVTTSVTNSNYMFTGSEKLIGGAGTVYDAEHIDKEYAHIDGGSENPGYFTHDKNYSITEGEETNYYRTIEEAIKAATNGQTIVIINDFVDNSEATINNKNIIFDNNEKTLTLSKPITINNGATLEITGDGAIQTEKEIDLIINNGTLNLTHTGLIENTFNGNKLAINNTGTINKTGEGTISAYSSTILSSAGTIKITAGTISVTGSGELNGKTIEATGATTAEITGGAINNSGNKLSSAIYWASSGELVLDGEASVSTESDEEAEAEEQSYGIQNASTTGGTITIKDGTYTNTGIATIFNNGSGTINVQGGSIIGSNNAVLAESTGTINISGSVSITGENIGINAKGSSKINISETPEIEGDNISGIELSDSSEVNLLGGTIAETENGVAAIINGGTLNVGDQDLELSDTNPVINGKINVNQSQGEWNFYNGLIKYKADEENEEDVTQAGYNVSNVAATNIRPEHEVKAKTEGEYNIAFLKSTRNYIIVGKTGYYRTLEQAHEASISGDTIQLINDTEDDSDVVITKNVKLDTNGYTLEKTTNGITIQSGATFEIAGEGTLTTSERLEKNIDGVSYIALINNLGTLNITHSGTISDTSTEASHCIKNVGTLNKTGTGTITTSTTWTTIGNVGENAKVTISSGVVSGTGTNGAIHTYDNGQVIIEGNAYIVSESGTTVQVGHSTLLTGGAITMTGGKIESKSGNGISINTNATSGNVTVTGGEIKGNTNGILSGGSNKNITIGDENSTFSKTSPEITGGTYGVSISSDSSNTFNFYNGILKGTGAGYNNAPNNTRSGYGIANGTEEIEGETYKTAYLGKIVNVTYDYNISDTINSGEWIDTGYIVDWNKDFTLSTVVNLPETGKRYLLFGNYVSTSSTSKDLGVEINTSNQLRVWMNGAQRAVSTGTVKAGEDITITYTWKASTKTYTMTSTGTNSNASLTGTLDITGSPEKTLHFGTQDQRGSSTFNKITVKSAKITSPRVGGEEFANLPEAGERVDYIFEGWYTAGTGGNLIENTAKVPDNDITYYGHWNGVFSASKTNVTIECGDTTTVQLGGKNVGTISVQTATKSSIATTSLSNKTLSITGVSVGTTSVTLKEANENRTVTINITVVQKDISKCTISSIAAQTYDGSAKTPTFTVTNGSKTLTKGTDYTVDYKNNTNAGTATVTITGKGNYKGTKSTTFTINKAAPTLTLSATSGTIIAGNSTTFTITYNGDGALSVKSSATGTATASLSSKTVTVKGVADGSATITVTAAAGTNYSAKTATYAATVQKALYEVSSVASGKLKYHTTLANAVSASNAGATVKALANTSGEGATTINKNLTINTNGHTLTRTGALTISAGTVTISGSGGITNTSTTEIAVTGSGTLKTSGSPTLKGSGNIITVNSTGGLSLGGGYVYSTNKRAISVSSCKATITITSTNVYSDCYDQYTIYVATGATGATTINGSSRIGGGNIQSSDKETGRTVIRYGSTGKLTINGSAWVTCKSKKSTDINLYAKCDVAIGGSSRGYCTSTMTNSTSVAGNACIAVKASGCKITFNTTGYWYATGWAVTYSDEYNVTVTVTKGHFVSRGNKYMFDDKDDKNRTASSGSAGDRLFKYMTAYNNSGTGETTVSGCYYYEKGV